MLYTNTDANRCESAQKTCLCSEDFVFARGFKFLVAVWRKKKKILSVQISLTCSCRTLDQLSAYRVPQAPSEPESELSLCSGDQFTGHIAFQAPSALGLLSHFRTLATSPQKTRPFKHLPRSAVSHLRTLAASPQRTRPFKHLPCSVESHLRTLAASSPRTRPVKHLPCSDLSHFVLWRRVHRRLGPSSTFRARL